MKRLLVDAIPALGALAEVPNDELHHLLKVRRVKDESKVELLDGKGGRALASFVPIDRRRAEVRVLEILDDARESPLNLTLALAIPESLNTIDTMLPGLVQLGVNRVVLVPTDYGGRVKKDADKYLQRLHEIARQSLKQCGRSCVPTLELATRFPAALDICADHQANWLLHPGDAAPASQACGTSLSLWIGPEGGFSDGEVAQWRERNCGPLVSLGPRILKMETAVIGAAFYVQRSFGDLA